MSVDRLHAFAEGVTFPPPERLGHLPPAHPDIVSAKRVWEAFRAVATVSDDALLGPNAWPINLTEDRAALVIGGHSVLRGIVRVEKRGHISIGEYCYVGDDVILSAHAGITIEPDVLIAHGCQIFDNVSHPIDAGERAAHYRAILSGKDFKCDIPATEIYIERSAWIGLNSIIMRGVTIGARCIVAAGSVVLDSTEQDTVVAGNPARMVKTIPVRSAE